jgi:glycosyltransferase involved in cell wall biosynthesis
MRWIKYTGDFEVIVVNGPSTDNTQSVIESFENAIKFGRCDVANLSVSRNIGIAMASGDIVAFIDDDAVPEPEWLRDLASAYDSNEVGAAGGFVFDHTGYSFQYQYCEVDRLSAPTQSANPVSKGLCFPNSNRIPHLLGCNSSFRRSALIEIGGFDEEFEYYLDETDVCIRLIDAGYVIAPIGRGFVHHKYAPSAVRDVNKLSRNRYPIIKNRIYFTMKHARDHHTPDEIFSSNLKFVDHQRNEVSWAIGQGLFTVSDREKLDSDIKQAFDVGLRRGLEGARDQDMLTAEKLDRYASPFKPFPTLPSDEPGTLVFVCRDYPPDHAGGIATFNKDLAEALAATGRIVCVVTKSPDFSRVDFENGVWVHRMAVTSRSRSDAAAALGAPQHIWDWSATAFDEVTRIATHRPVDVVEAPIWDCEGLAFLLDRRWPLVTSLQTTLKFWLDSHPHALADEAWMNDFARPMLAIEKALLTEADGVRSISAAIRGDIEKSYEIRIPDDIAHVVRLGMPDIETPKASADTAALTLLFVGRLERRKGIDVLLAALPGLLDAHPSLFVRIIGDDTLPAADGRTYRAAFDESETGKSLAGRIRFEGKVDEETLNSAYAACDIFVAPSRFESFGLIFLEAMRYGKPVIGCNAGGMPEIITDGDNGFLVPPGDAMALAGAIDRLVRAPSLRAAMGARGREVFLERFTSARMAAQSIPLIDAARRNFKMRGA